MCQQEGFFIDRLELVLDPNYASLAEHVVADIEFVSPGTEVNLHFIEQQDPWDFAEIYTKLRDFANNYPFDLDHEDYMVNMTTGTHVAQICWFLQGAR
jgi:transcriptional regulatory protein RtcR